MKYIQVYSTITINKVQKVKTSKDVNKAKR